jgi:S-adenosylmethionine uptake transporter
MPTTDRPSAPTHPLVIALAGVIVLTCMDAIVKWLSGAFGTFQIALLRFAFGALFAALLLLRWPAPWPPRARMPAYLARALLMVVTSLSFYYALGQLPLAELFALTFTAPLFIALFGMAMLKERLRPAIGLALAAGFAGMLVIVDPDIAGSAGHSLPWLAWVAAFTAPVAYALNVVLWRAQATRDPIVMIVTVQSLMVTGFVAPLAAIDFRALDLADIGVFAAVGVLGTTGQLLFTAALARTTAVSFSVVEYTGLIWAAIIGYAFFAEVPRGEVWAGAGLIIAGCLVVIRTRTPPA